MNYLGIDIGTSGCKAVVFDSEGQLLCEAHREYDVLSTADGGAELDPDAVIDYCFQLIRECTSQLGSRSVQALGISSQGEAFTTLGSAGETLFPAMVSSDMRSLPCVERFVKQFGEDKLYRITGHTAHPLFTIFKLLWLKDQKPDIWKKASRFLCFEDLLQFRLGLKPAISWPLAGRTMMFDVMDHRWHPEILAAVGITAKQLATPMPSGSIIGKIPQPIASDLGFSENTLVVAGGHDQPCSALGAGVIEAGMAMYATGTVECITPAFDQPIFTDALQKNNLCTYDHTVKEMYTTVAFSLTGGNLLKWFKDQFGAAEIIEAKKGQGNVYEILLQKMVPKPSELLVLPYFTPSGTPYFDSCTKGAIVGLRLYTQRTDILRALLEGVIFEMRLNLEILENSGYHIHELRAVGGGAKSPIWTQLKSDMLGKKITTMNVVEAGCFGAAMLACSADTGDLVQKIAKRWVKSIRTLHPQMENKKQYDEKFRLYKKLYKLMKELPL